MKLIGILGGVVAIRESPEEYMPEAHPPFDDLINTIKDEFKFSNYPSVAPGAAPPPIYNFIAGRHIDNQGKTFAVGRISMGAEYDIVAAGNTDLADIVLDRLLTVLDERFGFKTRSANNKKFYLSNVVVEFDDALENSIRKMGEIAQLIKAPNRPEFRLKHLSFGDGFAPPQLLNNNPMLPIENADFVIERRVGHPVNQNRFFSSAPMATTAHIDTLERIEAIARK